MFARRHRCLFIFWLINVAGLFATLAGAEGVSISISHTFPKISEFDPPLDPSLEGSTEVHLSADGFVRVVGQVPWLIHDSMTAFHTVFAWNDTTVRQVSFTDSVGDTIDLEILPEPVMPLDASGHGLPVVHITTDKQNLWDPETGIYVWGDHTNFEQRGDDWERPAQFEFYDANGGLELTEPIGLRINGQSSRAYNQKGLRIYFDDYGTSDSITHDFFGDGPAEFERLVLRGSRYPGFAISSAVNEPLHKDLGHPGSRHLAVAVYLNNEYWGLYSLRERLDSKFVETTHDWADDDYTLIKDCEAEEGDYGLWEDFLAPFSEPGFYDSHQFFESADSQLDLDSYLDWIMLNTCGGSADNMAGKNLGILKVGGQKWKFMAWDEDLLYSTYNSNADHLRFYSANTWAEFEEFKPPVWYSGGPWAFTWDWNNLLRSLMQNAEFKARLRHRGAYLLDGPMSTASIIARVDSVATLQGPEWVNHQDRWSGANGYTYKANLVRTFVSGRTDTVRDLLADFLAFWAQPVELSHFQGERDSLAVNLVWHTEREEDCQGFQVERSVGSVDQFTLIASFENEPDLVGQGQPDIPADYQFADEAAPEGENLYYRLTHVAGDGSPTVHNWVVAIEHDPVFDLRLNEFLAKNDSQGQDEAGEFDDWVEIYNSGSEPASLAGLFLTDNLSETAKWAFPDTVLEPGAFLIVWCDEDMDQGPLHASFKLSGNGEALGLYSGFTSDNIAIDGLVFPAQATDVSWGRQLDGEGDWVSFWPPTPGWTNLHSSPVIETDLPDTGPRQFGLEGNHPNPFNPETMIRFSTAKPGHVDLSVFDLRGQLVVCLIDGILPLGDHEVTWRGRGESGLALNSGLYILRLASAEGEVTRKITLLK